MINMKRLLLVMFLVVAALMTVGNASAALTAITAPDSPIEWTHDTSEIVDLNTACSGLTCLTGTPNGETLGIDDPNSFFTASGTCTSTECKVTITQKISNWKGSSDVTFWYNDGTTKTSASATTKLEVKNVAPQAVGTIPSPITTEEDKSVSITLRATDGDMDDLTYSISINPTHGSLSTPIVDPTTGLGRVTYTPTSQYHGSDSFSFKANDGIENSGALAVSISVTSVNDAPVLTVTTKDLQEGIEMSGTTCITPSVSDADIGDIITIYSLDFDGTQPEGSTFDIASYFDATEGTICGWTPAKADVGELKLKLTATDAGGASDTESFTLDIQPSYMCEEGKKGDYFSMSIDSPDDGDDFGPGDIIDVKVNVANGAGSDKDVIVSAVLYDLSGHKKIVDAESDSENIAEDEDFDFDFDLELPMDSDEDYKGDYVLYVKAYEDGSEDEQCLSEFVNVDVKRDSDRVIVNDFVLSPSNINAGSSMNILVDVLSIGKSDQDEVYVKVSNTELGIELASDKVALGAYDEGSNTHTFKFSNVKVPITAKTDKYTMDVIVLYDGNSEKYLDSPTYVATATKNVLNVKGLVIDANAEIGDVEQATENTYSIPVKITNVGDVTGSFTLSVEGLDDLAEPIEEKTVTLAAGRTKTETLDLVLLEDVKAEKYVVDVVVTAEDGKEVSRESFELDLSEATTVSAKGWMSSKTFWIIGDIVLVVVAIFFLKLIFGGRRPDIQEVKL